MSERLSFESPLGPLTLEADQGTIVALDWGNAPPMPLGRDRVLLQSARDQVLDYLEGRRRDFDLPLAPAATPHQQKVWDAMRRIPDGETMTYGAMAAAVGSAPRAVGLACGRNPIPIIIPCHRVVAADGQLGGYSGGAGGETKRWLLALEGHALR